MNTATGFCLPSCELRRRGVTRLLLWEEYKSAEVHFNWIVLAREPRSTHEPLLVRQRNLETYWLV